MLVPMTTPEAAQDADQTRDELLTQWQLTLDGDPLPSADADRVQPVRTHDGRLSMLVVRGDRDAAASEVLALKTWKGDGAVELQRALPSRGGLLLERFDTDALDGSTDADAAEELPGATSHLDPEVAAVQRVAILWPQLHRPASPALPLLEDHLEPLFEQMSSSPRGLPVPPRLAHQASEVGRGLLASAGAPVTLHGNLHSGHVARARGADVAFHPVGLAGDWGWEAVAPLAATDARGERLQDLFWTLVDTTGLDERRIRDWIVVGAVCRAVQHAGDRTMVSRMITLAKTVGAVQLGDPWV